MPLHRQPRAILHRQGYTTERPPAGLGWPRRGCLSRLTRPQNRYDCRHAPVAQWIEHRSSEPRVAGSSPAGCIRGWLFWRVFHAGRDVWWWVALRLRALGRIWALSWPHPTPHGVGLGRAGRGCPWKPKAIGPHLYKPKAVRPRARSRGCRVCCGHASGRWEGSGRCPGRTPRLTALGLDGRPEMTGPGFRGRLVPESSRRPNSWRRAG